MTRIISIFIFIVIVIDARSQEVSLPPKLFTLRNARISMGLGFEVGYASNNKGGLYKFNGSPKELNSVIDSGGYGAWNVAFDLYAPNSFIGFCVEANYGSWDLSLHNDSMMESFVVRSVEIPFYLKLRPGSIQSKGHIWLLLGASYIIPIGLDRKINNFEDNDKSQLLRVKTTTGMLGYEYFFGERTENRAIGPKGTWDRMRIVFFARYTYLLSSRLNPDYYQLPTTESILKNYKDFSYTDYTITFGIKYFFRLGKFSQGI